MQSFWSLVTEPKNLGKNETQTRVSKTGVEAITSCSMLHCAHPALYRLGKQCTNRVRDCWDLSAYSATACCCQNRVKLLVQQHTDVWVAEEDSSCGSCVPCQMLRGDCKKPQNKHLLFGAPDCFLVWSEEINPMTTGSLHVVPPVRNDGLFKPVNNHFACLQYSIGLLYMISERLLNLQVFREMYRE